MEDALAGVEPGLRTFEIPPLAIGKFVAKDTTDRRREVGEGKILEEIESVAPLPSRINPAIAETNQIRHAGLPRRFDEERHCGVTVEHDSGETDVEIVGVIVHINPTQIR